MRINLIYIAPFIFLALLGCKKKSEIEEYIGTWEVVTSETRNLYNPATGYYETRTYTSTNYALFYQPAVGSNSINVQIHGWGSGFEFDVDPDGTFSGKNRIAYGEFHSKQYATWTTFSEYTLGNGSEDFQAFKIVD